MACWQSQLFSAGRRRRCCFHTWCASHASHCNTDPVVHAAAAAAAAHLCSAANILAEVNRQGEVLPALCHRSGSGLLALHPRSRINVQQSSFRASCVERSLLQHIRSGHPRCSACAALLAAGQRAWCMIMATGRAFDHRPSQIHASTQPGPEQCSSVPPNSTLLTCAARSAAVRSMAPAHKLDSSPRFRLPAPSRAGPLCVQPGPADGCDLPAAATQWAS